MTGRATIQGFCKNRGGEDGHGAAGKRFLNTMPYVFLYRIHPHRLLEDTIPNGRTIHRLAIDPNEPLYIIIPGGDVFVANRPVDAVSIG